MAKSYSVAEAVEILKNGTDVDEIVSLAKHAPLFTYRATKLIAKAPEEFAEFAECLPEYVTTTKINNTLRKAATDEGAEEETDQAEDPKPAKKRPVKKTEKTDDDAPTSKYAAMSLAEIKNELDSRGLRETCKEMFGNARKVNAVKLLEGIDSGEIVVGEKPAVEPEEIKEEAGQYDGIPAMKLFKMCKERDIKAAPKKPAKYYIELLEAADAEAATEAADDDDDWDDVEETVEEVAEETEASEDDDDDDWDI